MYMLELITIESHESVSIYVGFAYEMKTEVFIFKKDQTTRLSRILLGKFHPGYWSMMCREE